MSEKTLDVAIKAVELMDYTMTITSNRKRYPAKHLMLVRRIQEKSFDIYEFLLEANRLLLSTSKIERNELQTKAVTGCDKLSCYVELSMKLNLVGSDTVAKWQKKINDVKYMTLAWRNKDKDR